MTLDIHSETKECIQVGTLNSIQQLIKQLSEFQMEERQERRDSEKRIADALEKIADQNARIVNLENADTSNKKEVNLLYGLHRELETKVIAGDPRLDAINTFYQLTTNKYAIGTYSILLFLILSDTISNLMNPESFITTIVKNVFN